MNTTINTVARFMISVFYIANGFLLMNSFHQKDLISAPSLSLVFFAVGCIELLSGLFLFLGYKKSGSAILLFICTLTTLFLQHGALELLNNAALAAALLLIINNKSGITFWEYVQTDINDLPDYKVKM